jgi:hypothetical protein
VQSVVGGLCDSPSSHPQEQYRFPCLARSQSLSLGLRRQVTRVSWHQIFCLGFSSPSWVHDAAHVCVWSAACHEVLAYLNTLRAEALTLACPCPVEARIFVFMHICCTFWNTTRPVRVYYPGTEFIVISESIFPETPRLLCTEFYCIMWCIHFYILWRKPVLSIRLYLGISSATVDDLW